jgi:hypothetical protein
MPNTHPKCTLCNKGITQHVSFINCSTCNHPTHSKCLPLYLDSDIQYAQDIDNHWSCPKCLENFFPLFSTENNEDIIGNFHNHTPFNLESLENMLFDPFELNEDGGFLDEIDPDTNFYNIHASNLINTCKYLLPDQLRSSINKLNFPINLSAMHLNIRSLKHNHTAFDTLLNSLNHTFSFIGLTETWLKPHNASLFNIPGYSHKFLTRENKPGGGLSLFKKDSLEYKVCHNLSYSLIDSEMLWIELEG